MQVYNTLGRRKEPLRSPRDGPISMYVCGVTAYDYCHLGHARVLVVFDAFVRVLRMLGYRVRYVRNITDIDDKILRRAAERDEPFESLTGRFIEAMHDDERALSVLPPDEEPRATAHIDAIVALTQRLLDSGHAYHSDGDVYYAVSMFPGYGKLSGRNPDELLAGARIEPSERKRDPRDFALWKGVLPGDGPSWPAPWGAGRPGWHIECSAMALHCLGDSFDIHGGGPDLVFPHHENEIAQSEAATGKPFARLWMHVGPLRIGGEKMSKSLGNYACVRDILSSHEPEVLRYFLLSSHYRSPVEYNSSQLDDAARALRRLYTALRGHVGAGPATDADGGARTAAEPSPDPWAERFFAALEDDLNTPEALAVLFELARATNAASGASRAVLLARQLQRLGGALGILQEDAEVFLRRPATRGDVPDASVPDSDAVAALIAARDSAREQRDYRRADEIRQQLSGMGVALEDGAGSTRWRRS